MIVDVTRDDATVTVDLRTLAKVLSPGAIRKRGAAVERQAARHESAMRGVFLRAVRKAQSMLTEQSTGLDFNEAVETMLAEMRGADATELRMLAAGSNTLPSVLGAAMAAGGNATEVCVLQTPAVGGSGYKAPTTVTATKEQAIQAFELYKEGKKYKEIALLTGLNPNQVSGIVFKAKKKAAAIGQVINAAPAKAAAKATKNVVASVPVPTNVPLTSASFNNALSVAGVSSDHLISLINLIGEAKAVGSVSNEILTQTVKHFTTYGAWPTPKKIALMARMHEAGLVANGAMTYDGLLKVATKAGLKDTWTAAGVGKNTTAANQFSGPVSAPPAPYAPTLTGPSTLPTRLNPTSGDWPIDEKVNRVRGGNYPDVVAKKYDGWINSLPFDERGSLSDYTGSVYDSVNRDLRKPGSTPTAFATRITKALEKAPKPPPPELVWRGLRGGSETQAFVSKLASGDVIDMRGFQSTSIRPDFARSWSEGGVLFEIKPSAGGYIRHISKHDSEYEFLLPHAAKYKVRGWSKVFIDGEIVNVIQLEMLRWP